MPLHITQRGIDRCPTFLSSEDFAFYREILPEAQTASGCAVHAYVLMSNHVHLLVTPERETGPAELMRAIGRRYVRYFNQRFRRTGSLWEGRYRSFQVGSLDYLLACGRYIEMNPVRAGLVAVPGHYAWSSYRRNATGSHDPCVREHPAYTALGDTDDARRAAYRALFEAPLTSGLVATIRAAQHARPGFFRTPYREAVAAVFGHEWSDGTLLPPATQPTGGPDGHRSTSLR